MRRWLTGVFLAIGLWSLCPFNAYAQSAAPRRHRRDRWSNTLSLGATIGAGSPLGALGAFLEYRPIRWVSVAAGGGFGGSFGPALGATLYVDPIVTRIWSIGIAGSLSHNFSWRSGEVVQGRRPLPDATNWGSVEVQTQLRPSRGVFVRLGVGYAVLFDTQAFNVGTEAELNAANLPSFAFQTPVDAMYSAARNETFGLWFVHLDIATVWRL